MDAMQRLFQLELKERENIRSSLKRIRRKIHLLQHQKEGILDHIIKIESQNLPLNSPSECCEWTPSNSKDTRSVVKRVRNVPRDENNKPLLPLKVGIFTLVSLGEVIYDNKDFHTKRYIYPLGYVVKRPYHSMVEANKIVIYTCSISQSEGKPLFKAVAEDSPNREMCSFSATGAWTAVIFAVNSFKKKDKSNSASGPDNFGLSNPTISMLIQELENANKCKNYISKSFIETDAPLRKRALT